MAWDELPEGWELRRLAEVAHINMGQSPPGSSYNQEGIGLPLVGGASDLGELYPSPSKWTSQPSKISKAGDIIICVRATIGDLNWADGEYCLGRGVAGLTAGERVEPRFLFYYLRSQHDELNAKGIGSTFKQISKSTLQELFIPLPPLPEQRRIVARIEELTERIDAARRLRAEAVEEAAAILPTALAEVFGEAAEKEWEFKIIKEVSKRVINGSTPSRKVADYYGGDIAWVSPADLSGQKYVSSSKETLTRKGLQEGGARLVPKDAVLVSCTASLGKAAIAECDLTTNQQINSVVLKEFVLPEFFYYLALTLEPVLRRLSTKATVAYVSKTKFETIEVPIAPLSEQRRIIEYLDGVQVKVEAIRRCQAETQQEIEAMTGAVLERAFRGEL